jgi:hypothetical protein
LEAPDHHRSSASESRGNLTDNAKDMLTSSMKDIQMCDKFHDRTSDSGPHLSGDLNGTSLPDDVNAALNHLSEYGPKVSERRTIHLIGQFQ